jgi:hypothetical protein
MNRQLNPMSLTVCSTAWNEEGSIPTFMGDLGQIHATFPFDRRPSGEMIAANQPDVMYLYEGADCSGGSFDLASERVAWNDSLNAGVTRYRIGEPVEVLSTYIPVSLVVQGDINGRVLVRRAFLQDECWKRDVQSDLCRRM